MEHQPLVTFLAQLATHNDKGWFVAHRAEYDQLRAAFTVLIQTVIDGIRAFDPAIGELDPTKSLYRINRDVRFSKDKRPYKTNFSAILQPGGKKSGIPGYYLHIDKTGTLLVAAGFHELMPEQLLKIRTAIAAPKSKLANSIHDGLNNGFVMMDDDKLKKVPSGFTANHPQAELLKLKSAVLYREQAAAESNDLAQTMITDCHTLWPFTQTLRIVLV